MSTNDIINDMETDASATSSISDDEPEEDLFSIDLRHSEDDNNGEASSDDDDSVEDCEVESTPFWEEEDFHSVSTGYIAHCKLVMEESTNWDSFVTTTNDNYNNNINDDSTCIDFLQRFMMDQNQQLTGKGNNCELISNIGNSDDYSFDVCLENSKRCNEILECKKQIKFWTSRLEQLQKQHAQFITLRKLQLDARSTWRKLSRDEKHNKYYILAALRYSPTLPAILEDFPNNAFPLVLRIDKDLLLARMKRSDFLPCKLYLPSKLRHDKQVIMELLSIHHNQNQQALSTHILQVMGNKLRNDPEVLQLVLQQSLRHSLALPTQCLQYFSENLRSDKKLMYQVLTHHIPLEVLAAAPATSCPTTTNALSLLPFVSVQLRNDKQFILSIIHQKHLQDQKLKEQRALEPKKLSAKEVATKKGSMNTVTPSKESFTILRHVSHRLRADYDVVLAAVQQNGMNLKHASYALRRDEQIIRTACLQTGNAFKFCLPGAVKQALSHDISFISRIMETGCMSSSSLILSLLGGNDNKESNNSVLSKHPNLLMHAIVNGALTWKELPKSLQQDITFISNAVSKNPQLYMELSTDMKANSTIALSAIQAKDTIDDIILEATGHVPELLANRSAMLSIVQHWWTDVLEETLQFSPLTIRGDKALMMEAIKYDSIAFEYCSEALQRDIDIVRCAVEALPSNLYLVSEAFQIEHPDIVITAIKNTDRDDLWTVYDDICEDLWLNRDVAMAWLCKGGEWLDDDFDTNEFCLDRELLLAVAEHNWSQFDYAHESLKCDKEFLLQAVAKDGRILQNVSDELRHDFDMALQAFSQSIKAVGEFATHSKYFEFLVSFAKSVRDRLGLHRTFTKEILCAISFATMQINDNNNDNPCYLSLLNQGPETSMEYKQLIASYVGLPSPTELRLLRFASKNLWHWGF